MKLIVGLGVIAMTIAIVNLVYTTVINSMPEGSTPLFDLTVINAAANLVGPLLLLLVGGAIIMILINIARASA